MLSMSLHNPTEADLTQAYFAGLRGMGDVDPSVAEDLGIPTGEESFEAHAGAGRTVAKELGGLVVDDPNAEARERDRQIYQETNNLTPPDARTTEEERDRNLEIIRRIRHRDGI